MHEKIFITGDAALTNQTQIFQIEGLDCPDCARTLENGVRNLEGVQSCNLNFNTGKLQVAGSASADAVIKRIEEFGHEASISSGERKQKQPTAPIGFLDFMWKRYDTRLALLGLILVLPGIIFEEILGRQSLMVDILSVAAMISAGWPIFRSAFQAIRLNHEININVLMSIASIGAVLIGAYTEAGMVMVLFAVGEALEGYATHRSRDSIRSLMEIVPNTASLLVPQNGSFRPETVNIESLKIGDSILVKPGERIPMDGDIVSGISYINQAPITGESRLIEKQPGDHVFASSINGEGSLEIIVTHLAADNTISRLIQMVEEAQEKRAPAQRFVDQFAKYYTPFVVMLAVLVMVVPPVFFNQPFFNPDANTFGWFYRGLALLVVGCPCALVISTPVSIISAISNAAHSGVLIKGGAQIETLNKVKAIAFDKTGTLTRGKPSVVSVLTQNCTCEDSAAINLCKNCKDLIALASAVEEQSEHPLAQAILSEADRYNIRDQYAPASSVTAMAGRGVSGQVNGHAVTISSHNHFHEIIPENLAHHSLINAEELKGYTPMLITVDGQYEGTIYVADSVRPTSQQAVQELKDMKVGTLVMLSGDNTPTAQHIGQEIGIDIIQAELLPEQKVAAIQQLKEKYGTVAMVGDGINDAPALATADVSFAVGTGAQAMETADIALLNDDLRQIPFTLKLSQATMRTIKINVAFALAVKFAFMILVLIGKGTMWMAVFADMGASLLVILNGLQLLRKPRSPLI